VILQSSAISNFIFFDGKQLKEMDKNIAILGTSFVVIIFSPTLV
jgi:hypothetical protein